MNAFNKIMINLGRVVFMNYFSERTITLIPKLIRLFGKFTFFAFTLSALSGCLKDNQLLPTDASSLTESGFQGCVSGTAMSTSRIRIQFSKPDGASAIRVLRDGIPVASYTSNSVTTYEDTGLNEGQSYLYTCEASLSDIWVEGDNTLLVTTLLVNPPDFDGLKSISSIGSHGFRVNWNPEGSSGVPASYFNIYVTPGPTVDFDATPYKVATEGSIFVDVASLGDEMKYSVGVRACNNSDVCDDNTVSQTINTLDGGAPQTTGATTAVISNGSIVVTAPFTHTMGGMVTRQLYKMTGAFAANTVNSLSGFTLAQTKVVASNDIYQPPTTLSISGLSENTQYNFIVVDTDPTGNVTSNWQVAKVTTSDLTPPSFTGLTNLTRVDPKDSSLLLSFNAIAREGTSDTGAANGASNYLIYLTSAIYPGTPGDPCTSGTLHSTVSTATYAPGAQQITLNGLNERTTYSVCMKAQDAAGNISNTVSYQTQTTLDLTPPTFYGIQEPFQYNVNTSKLELVWLESTSSDIKNYKVELWTSANPTPVTTRTEDAATYSAGVNYTKGVEFAFTDGDNVYARVNACDDASTLPGGADNCTTLTTFKIAAIPDATPPANFPGIKTADVVPNTEGSVLITWYDVSGQSDYTDYAGFQISYVKNPGVDDSLQEVVRVDCANSGACNNTTDLQYTQSGLDPHRTYRFVVKAYDAAGNLSTNINPTVNFKDVTTLDTTPPTFSSSLSLGAGPQYNLSWNAATDNQYTGSITYKVFRKQDNNFDFATYPNPANDPGTTGAISVFNVNSSLTYTSNSGLTEGKTYYFTICAYDDAAAVPTASANNQKCDQSVVTYEAPDLTPPTVTDIQFIPDPNDSKRWKLKWNMTDNKPVDQLSAIIYESHTATAGTATTSDTLTQVFALPDVTTGPNAGDTTSDYLRGPQNLEKYVNYLLVVSDQAGNTTTKTYSLHSDNRITFTSIARNSGLQAGGKIVKITGTGFTQATVDAVTYPQILFSFGGNDYACTDLTFIDSTTLFCTNPGISGSGYVDVRVENSDGSSATINSGFQYLVTSSEPCDNPPSGSFSGTGNGSDSAHPYVICSATDFANIGTVSGSPKYFELGDNIDFASTPNTMATALNGQFDGKGYAIVNSTINQSSTNNIALFQSVVSGSIIKDLMIINFNHSGADYTGGLIADASTVSADNLTVSGIYLTGNITSSGVKSGGLIGSIDSDNLNIDDISGNVDLSGTKDLTGLITGIDMGGLIGQDYGLTQNISNVNLTVTSTRNMGNVSAGGYLNLGGLIGNATKVGTTFAQMDLDNITLNVDFDAPYSGAIGGLFGKLNGEQEKTFSNITINATVNGSNFLSSMIGVLLLKGNWQSGSAPSVRLLNSDVIGNITGTSFLGGFIGGQYTDADDPANTGGTWRYTSLVIDNATFNETISGSPSGQKVGGLVGGNLFLLISSISKLGITGTISGGTYVGGFAGHYSGSTGSSITDCVYGDCHYISDTYVRTNVTGVDYVSGFVAYSRGRYHFNNIVLSGNVSGNNYVSGFRSNTDYGGGYCLFAVDGPFFLLNHVSSSGTKHVADRTCTSSEWTNYSTHKILYDSTIAAADGSTLPCGNKISYPTVDLQNPSLESTDYTPQGFDFSSGSPAWRWPASTPAYPVLNWESTP